MVLNNKIVFLGLTNVLKVLIFVLKDKIFQFFTSKSAVSSTVFDSPSFRHFKVNFSLTTFYSKNIEENGKVLIGKNHQ